MHKRQHAFRIGKSCDSALTETVNFIEKGINQEKYTVGVFLDIKGAFDNVDPDEAIKALEERKLPKYFIKVYGNYIKNRKITANFMGETKSRWIALGCPQGGVMSPTFWNLIFDILVEKMNSNGSLSVAFADDGDILTTGENIDTIRNFTQDILRKAEEWGKRFKLTFCPKKSVVMIFSRHGIKTPEMKPLTLSDKELPIVEDTKYLGITLDKHLSFNKHITNTIESCRRALAIYNGKVKASHGPIPRLSKWVYTGVVLKKLLYGCHIWEHKLTKTLIQKLTTLNRKGAQCIANVFPGTPTEGLQAIMDIPPIELQIKETAMSNIMRIQPKENWDGLNKKGNTVGHVRTQYRNLKKIKDYKTPDNHKSLNTFTLDIKFNKDYREVIGSPEAIEVYTDGALKNNQAGIGIIVKGMMSEDKTYNARILRQCTAIQTEIYAIKKAAEKILKMKINNKHIIFFTDCKMALQALNKTKFTDTLTRSTADTLKKLEKYNKSLQLRWIKGHNGITGNQEADIEAKIGMTRSDKMTGLDIEPTVKTCLLYTSDAADE